MSRIANRLITIPNNVIFSVSAINLVTVKGKYGSLKKLMHQLVKIDVIDHSFVKITSLNESKIAYMHAGTTNALINNMIIGVSNGFKKHLQLVGIGYRVSVENNVICLMIGFSHVINYNLPTNVNAVVHNQTDIILSSADKELLGQVAADIRKYRKPEVYKGKGIRYINENIITKEPKKK